MPLSCTMSKVLLLICQNSKRSAGLEHNSFDTMPYDTCTCALNLSIKLGTATRVHGQYISVDLL